MPLQLWDDLEEEFTLLGVRSRGLDEIRFVYNFNKVFNYRFYRVEDLDIRIKNQEYCFSLYCHDNEEEESKTYIIKNHSHPKQSENSGGSLFDNYSTTEIILNKYKIFDYLIKFPCNQNEIGSNPLPLTKASFIQKMSIISSLTNREKKLLFI